MSGRRRVDWSFGPGHGPVSGVCNAAAAAWSAAAVAYLVDRDAAQVHPAWLLAAGVVAGVASLVVAQHQQAPPVAQAYRLACWWAAGLWAFWTLAGRWLPTPPVGPRWMAAVVVAAAGFGWLGWRHGAVARFAATVAGLAAAMLGGWLLVAVTSPGNPWSVPAVAALAVGAVGAAILGLAFARAQRRAEDTQAQAEAQRAAAEAEMRNMETKDRIAAQWTPILKQITRRDLTVVGVQMWDPPTGYTLDVDLPADGTTIDDVKPHEKSLATAAPVDGGLPVGCGVEVLAGETGRRQILIRVATENAMAEDHVLPEGDEPDTIENDLSTGVKPDRAEAGVNLRFNNLVLVGQVDSGKSTQLNVLTRRLGFCTDVYLCAVDISGGGRYPRAWVRAWREGRAGAPVIDWVANTDELAELMTLALIQVIDGRTVEYEQLMHQQRADKIMPSPDLPQIIVLVDEFGKLPAAVKDNLRTISDTGRGAAVRVVSCALEATAGYIPRAMVTQARERIGMRVTDEQQLQYLFDATWSRGRFDPASIPYKGSGLVSTGAQPPDVFKGFWLPPERIDRDSVVAGALRPPLDEVSVRLADTVRRQVVNARGEKVWQEVSGVWTRRWDMALPVMFPAAAAGTTSAPRASGGAVAVSERPRTGAPDLGEALANLEATKQRLRDAVAAHEAGQSGQEPAGGNPDEVAQLNAMLAEELPARERMRQLVVQAGDKGTGPGPVHEQLKAEGYPTSYPTVVNWMKDDAAAGILHQPGGDRTPYFPGPKLRGT